MIPEPLVSVIVPAYNQAHFLPETIDSVLAQTYRNWEIIILDDGSTDDTPEVAKRYTVRDKRIRYEHQENRGLAAARNKAISFSKGEYLCLLDADDLMEKDKISLQLAEFKNNPDVDIVYTAVQFIDTESKYLSEMRSQDYPPEDFLAHLFFRNPIPTPSTMMAKRRCFADNPYNESFRRVEDYELTLRLAHKYRFKYLDKPLTRYRRHKQNMSNDLALQRQAELHALKKYTPEHIEGVIARSSLSNQDKQLMLGKILFNMELFEQAVSVFDEIPVPIAKFYLGNCYLKLG